MFIESVHFDVNKKAIYKMFCLYKVSVSVKKLMWVYLPHDPFGVVNIPRTFKASSYRK